MRRNTSFRKNGLHGVTLRDVALRVGVHTTLLHYYFDDKRSLFDAVFARRAGVTSGRRMEALNAYEVPKSGENPTVAKAPCTPFWTPIWTSTSRAARPG